jgi:hypothetical protein
MESSHGDMIIKHARFSRIEFPETSSGRAGKAMCLIKNKLSSYAIGF